MKKKFIKVFVTIFTIICFETMLVGNVEAEATSVTVDYTPVVIGAVVVAVVAILVYGGKSDKAKSDTKTSFTETDYNPENNGGMIAIVQW